MSWADLAYLPGIAAIAWIAYERGHARGYRSGVERCSRLWGTVAQGLTARSEDT